MKKKGQDYRLLRSQKYTLSEAALHFRVSVRTLRRWIKDRKVQTIRPFHFHLVTGDEIERILGALPQRKGQEKLG